MPVVPVGSQIFDLAFHPTESVVYTGLLNGKVKAFTYDEQGVHSAAFELRISKRSCRGLALSPDGSSLYAVGKNKSLQCVATIKYNRSLHLRGSVLKYHRHRHWSVVRDTPGGTRVSSTEHNVRGPSVNAVHFLSARLSTASCTLPRISWPLAMMMA